MALYGPILDVTSVGELAMTKMTVLYAVLVALMLLFVVRRHTRGDEEGGQAELIGGAAIGRQAPLTAAVQFGAAVSLVLGLLDRRRQHRRRWPAARRLSGVRRVVGRASDWWRTGVTAVACQLSAERSHLRRPSRSPSSRALFVLRAVGDTTEASWLSWLSPFGWNTQLRAYGDTRWWVLLLYLALALAAGGVVHGAAADRDLGVGNGRRRVPGRPPARRGFRARSR